MQTKKPFQTYDGGKSGNGTYHNIINHIPPHRVRYLLTAGNCGIHHNIKPAEFHIINDIDPEVIKAWEATGIGLRGDYRFYNIDARNFLRYDIHEKEFARQYKHSFMYLDFPYLFSSRKNQLDMYRLSNSARSAARGIIEFIAHTTPGDQNND